MDPLTILAIVGALYGGGSLALGQLNKRQEHQIAREKMSGETQLEKSKIEAMARLLKEAKTSKRRDLAQLSSERQDERKEGRDAEMMRFFTESQNQRMGLLLQALQGLNRPVASQNSGGTVGLMRSNY